MGKIHEIETYVRFCDTDALGHVNNTRHFQYFEEARTKFFKAVYPERSASFSFILASIYCDYLAQAYADQILRVTTFVTNIGNH
ncbi:acyl-CoA thioesterase [Virgibacillus oceani]